MNRRRETAPSSVDSVPWSPFSRSLAVVVLVIGVFAFLGLLFQAGQTLMLGFLLAFLLYRPTRGLAGRMRFRASSGER